MQRLTIDAPAKINLSLDVVGRRDDGYHLLSTVMQSLDLSDTLWLASCPDAGSLVLTCDSAEIPTDRRNTAYRAAERFMQTAFSPEEFRPGLQLHIQKRIPAAAGLAGGSADAAGVLYGLSRLFPGRLTRERLFDLAADIGADVPFCLQGGTVLCEGIGERLTLLPAWTGLSVLLCKPQPGLSTAAVFSQLKPDRLGRRPDQDRVLNAVGKQDLGLLAEAAANVLETVSMAIMPELTVIRSLLTAAGAQVVLMSGSGPTVFGLFSRPETCEQAAWQLASRLPPETSIWLARTTAEGPRVTSIYREQFS